MKLVVTFPADVDYWTSELAINPDDPERWVAALLQREFGAWAKTVLPGVASSTRDGWPMQQFQLRTGTAELALAALYTFLAHSAVCLVRAVDEGRLNELRDALSNARPDWNGGVTALAQFYVTSVESAR